MTTGPVDALLTRATSRVVVRPGDARTGSVFERVEVEGDRYFLKRLSPASDWIMRVSGDHVHRPFLVWTAGIMDAAPPSIDHTVAAMQIDGTGDAAELSMLMRDVGDHLVPEGDEPVPATQHDRFMDHLADLGAAFWNWQDGIGLTTMAQRLRFFAPGNIAGELQRPEVPSTIVAADSGWRALADRSPLLHRVAAAVHADPTVLTDALDRLPVTFLHGDWKMGNLGSHPDGRTILLDWAYPGSGPLCWDLCWYLALNRARLPEPKEEAAARLRAALEHRGVSTADWWDEQLDLCTVGIMATFAWEKALGDEGELRWWERRVEAAVRRCALPATSGPT